MNKLLTVLLILMLTVIPAVSAANENIALTEGTTAKDGTEITLNNGIVSFEDTTSSLQATTTTEINSQTFTPAITRQAGDSLVWGTGEKSWFIFDDPAVIMSYQYSGKKLKETIILKEDKQLSFPITLDYDSKLIQWEGSWKIISATSGYTMKGIVLVKPYGIDANNKRIEMDYEYTDGKLNLVYNRTITTYQKNPDDPLNLIPVYSQIAYPLTIDPTWVAVGDRWDTIDGAYTILMWNTTGSTTFAVPLGVSSIDYLVLAGAGGGGSYYGGGGGAGGIRTGTGFSVTSGSTYTIVVGSGGSGGSGAGGVGSKGVNSSFGASSLWINATGGGGGASRAETPTSGGSGGGRGDMHPTYTGTGAVGNAGGYTPVEGYKGGDVAVTYNGGAGGGGAGAVGENVQAARAGNGGIGISSTITGIAVQYAGGGGGGALSGGTPGTASYGGGAGSAAAGNSGIANTGGGGGGAGDEGPYTGGNGGSGIILIKYLTQSVISSFTSVNITAATNKTAQGWAGNAPFIMQFTNTSTGAPHTSWVWNYTTTQAPSTPVTFNATAYYSPIYTFNSAGNYSIKLNVTGVAGTNISTQLTWVNVTDRRTNIPDFAGTPLLASNYGMKVQFSNTTMYSVPSTSVLWDFGDGYTNASFNPSHYYSVANRYTVTGTFTNATGNTVVTKTNYINLTSDLPGVVSWLHMDGVDGGTTFPGMIGSAWTPTSVVTTSSSKKFGNASALFDGDGDRLQTPSAAVFDFGAGDFTIEKWVNITSSANGQFIVSRTTNGDTKPDGWGIYHSTNSATSDAWRMWVGTSATQTDTFTLPLNTWVHLAAIRESGVLTIYVNGLPKTPPLAAAGNYDTVNAIVHGDPIGGGGAVKSARMRLDETRISNVARWTGAFSPPYAAYAGDLFAATTDPNPESTLRFKTNPSMPSNAWIGNMTPRNRTVQIQNVDMANNISAVVIFNPDHNYVSGVAANSTTFTGINFTKVIIDNTLGTVLINATRPGGFSTNALSENRASFADVKMVYWNYTAPLGGGEYADGSAGYSNIQFFGSGYLGNQTYSTWYPVRNFIATNVSYKDWVTYSNFTANTVTPIVNEEAVFLTNENNFTSNRVLWDFGDGTTFLSHNTSVTHVYTSIGAKTVTSTAYLWQNNSVTNTTTRLAYITPVYNASWVHADFSANPLSGTPGVAIIFTDLSEWGSSDALSGRTYNWSFGDSLYSTTPYSNVKGNVTHVYTIGGTYSVNLTINNTIRYNHEEKLNYIVVSTSQNTQTTFYSPHQVVFQIVDANLNPIVGTPVIANAVESTLPGGLAGAISTMTTTFGIPTTLATQMLDSVTKYNGTTDTQGNIVVTMLSSIQYQVDFTDTSGIVQTAYVYPKDAYYQLKSANATVQGIAAQSRSQTSINMNSTYKTTFWEPNTTHSCMGINVYDSTGQTSNVNAWWKLVDNGTVWWTNSTAIGGYGPVNSTMCVLHIPYQQWKWGGITG